MHSHIDGIGINPHPVQERAPRRRTRDELRTRREKRHRFRPRGGCVRLCPFRTRRRPERAPSALCEAVFIADPLMVLPSAPGEYDAVVVGSGFGGCMAAL